MDMVAIFVNDAEPFVQKCSFNVNERQIKKKRKIRVYCMCRQALDKFFS